MIIKGPIRMTLVSHFVIRYDHQGWSLQCPLVAKVELEVMLIAIRMLTLQKWAPDFSRSKVHKALKLTSE